MIFTFGDPTFHTKLPKNHTAHKFFKIYIGLINCNWYYESHDEKCHLVKQKEGVLWNF